MAIKDLKSSQGNINITLDITQKADIREFEKFGKKGRVCNAACQDETGTISLTLWNDDIDKVNAGDKIEIKNGYVSEFRGELQLSTGKFGQLIVVGKSTFEPKTESTGKSATQKPADTKENFEESDDMVHDAEDVNDDGE